MKHKYFQFVQGGWLLAALVFGLVTTMPAIAHAAEPEQNPNGALLLVVSPPSIGLQTTPGKATSYDLRVQNQGTATEHIKVNVMKFSAYGQDGQPNLQDVEANDDFAKWISFSTNKFDAEPKVWKTVKVTINPPKAAAFGYYYAVVFSRDNAKSTNNQANLLGAVASLVLLDVSTPGSVRQSKITEFSTPNKVQELLPVNFTVRMRNTGNTHVAPRGNIFITHRGKQVALLEVNLKKGYILPQSNRKFTASWADGSPKRVDKVVDGKTATQNGVTQTTVSWDKFGLSKLRMGKYNAKLVMVYNNGTSDISSEAFLSFWVIPWRVIGIVAVIAIVFLAGIWALFIAPLRRRIKQKGYADRK